VLIANELLVPPSTGTEAAYLELLHVDTASSAPPGAAP